MRFRLYRHTPNSGFRRSGCWWVMLRRHVHDVYFILTLAVFLFGRVILWDLCVYQRSKINHQSFRKGGAPGLVRVKPRRVQVICDYHSRPGVGGSSEPLPTRSYVSTQQSRNRVFLAYDTADFLPKVFTRRYYLVIGKIQIGGDRAQTRWLRVTGFF